MTLFEQFKLYAKAKPRDEAYDMSDGQNCAVAQFAKFIDRNFKTAGFRCYHRYDKDGLTEKVWINTSSMEYMNAVMHSSTWGQLADRLEMLVIGD